MAMSGWLSAGLFQALSDLLSRAPESVHGGVVLLRGKDSQNMDIALLERMEELRRLNVPALQATYREVCGEQTRCAHKQWLYRRIVWQLQAQAEGGLSERALRRANQIADEADLRTGRTKGFWSWTESAPVGPLHSGPVCGLSGRLPEPGSLLRRRYQGREVRVQVRQDGFEYQSRLYRSLSAIAREVTGTQWNGWAFFGLKERQHG